MTPSSQRDAGQDPLLMLQTVFARGGFGKGIGTTLGIRGVEAVHGSVTLEGRPTDDHINPGGTVHGGYLATLLDGAMALAVQTLFPVGTPYSTTTLTVTYVRPMRPHSTVARAVAAVTHEGRSLVVAQARVLDEHDVVYAHATATFHVARDAGGDSSSRPDG